MIRRSTPCCIGERCGRLADIMPKKPTDDAAEFRLQLTMGETKAAAVVQAPTRPMTVVDLLPVLQQFDNQVVELAETEVQRQGKRSSCCAGCGACCRQYVPISEPEARNLAALVAALPAERRAEIVRRFAAACATLDRNDLTQRLIDAPQIKDDDERGRLGLEYFALGIACPFLENESCGIYPDRPLACREFLVTSPAENCRNPGPDNIERVPLPAQLSERLYRFGEGGGKTAARWMPLVVALRWADEHGDEVLPRQPGHELFQRFLGGNAKG